MIKIEFINILHTSKEYITIILAIIFIVIGGFFVLLDHDILNVLSSFGIELVAGALLFLALDAKIRNAITSSAAINSKISFPKDIIDKIIRAKNDMIILTTFFSFIQNSENKDAFSKAIVGAMSRNVSIKILILEPISHASEQRFKNMVKADKDNSKEPYPSIKYTIETLRYLNKIHIQFKNKLFEVKIFNQLPPYILYRVDYNIFMTWYAYNKVSADEKFLILKHYSFFSDFLNDKFKEIWNSNDSNCSLDEYFYITIENKNNIKFIDIFNLETGEFPQPQILGISEKDVDVNDVKSENINYRGKYYKFSEVIPISISDKLKLNNFTIKIQENAWESYILNIWDNKYFDERPKSFKFIQLQQAH